MDQLIIKTEIPIISTLNSPKRFKQTKIESKENMYTIPVDPFHGLNYII